MRRTLKSAAVLLLALIASSVLSAQVKIVKHTLTFDIVPDRTGPPTWKLEYGLDFNTLIASSNTKLFVLNAKDGNSWFAYGTWLRLIDARSGDVKARWHIAGLIASMQEIAPGRVRLKTADSYYGNTFTFEDVDAALGPVKGKQRFVSNNDSTSRAEAVKAFYPAFSSSQKTKYAPEKAKPLLAAVDAMLQHDRLTPWFYIVRARLRRDLEDPDWRNSYNDALAIPTDFMESFRLASVLAEQEEEAYSNLAFDRGLKDFIQSGTDPRWLWDSYILRSAYQPLWSRQPKTRPEQYYENLYALSADSLQSNAIWNMAAIQARHQGDLNLAAKWEARSKRPVYIPKLSYNTSGDQWMDRIGGWVLALALTIALFLIHRHRSYDADLYSEQDAPEFEFMGLSRVQFWPYSDRITFFVFVLAAWLLAGSIGTLFTRSKVLWEISSNRGNAKFTAENILATVDKLPPSEECDLIHAMGLQLNGKNLEAEQAYRSIPQFAESWNNLGVLLKNVGKNEEARHAFQKALSISPGMEEAEYNLERKTQDGMSALLAKYTPEKPMLAVPSGSEWERALDGGNNFLQWLKGPFGWPMGRDAWMFPIIIRLLMGMSATIISISLLFSIVLLFLPYRQPGRRPKATPRFDLFVPGLDMRLPVLGPCITVLFVWALTQILAIGIAGTSFLVTKEANFYPRWFGNFPESIMREYFRSIALPTWELTALLGGLFLLNYWFVRKWSQETGLRS